MTDYLYDYKRKLIPKDDVIKFIHDGDRVLCHGGAESFLGTMDKNIESLHDVRLYTIFLLTEYYRFLEDNYRDNIRHHAAFVSGPVRQAIKKGHHPEINICHYSDTDRYVANMCRPNVMACQATPMDEAGYFYMGYNSMGHRAAIDMAERVIVQVNTKLPKIYGESNKVHISEVTAIYEEDTPMPIMTPPPFNEVDLRAAKMIAERIPDGATLQIGVGRVPDAIGEFLGDHQHLGVHTELFTQSLMKLMKKGVIDNSRKTLMPGKTIFAFAGDTRASQELYDYCDCNPLLEMHPIGWVNSPYAIRQNNMMYSINSAISVDLTGQVCAESIGLSIYSGTGGQLDFVRGALKSKGGRSFIVINSVAEKKDGTKVSKINLALPYGSAVTTPRADVDCIATEYGIAELKYKSLSERAHALIEIAHPEFRDELEFEARKAGYFI